MLEIARALRPGERAAIRVPVSTPYLPATLPLAATAGAALAPASPDTAIRVRTSPEELAQAVARHAVLA